MEGKKMTHDWELNDEQAYIARRLSDEIGVMIPKIDGRLDVLMALVRYLVDEEEGRIIVQLFLNDCRPSPKWKWVPGDPEDQWLD